MPVCDAKDIKISFIQTYYESLQANDITSADARAFLSDSIQIKYHISFEKKEPYLQYYFLPLRTNPQSGKPERLRAFVIRIEIQSNHLVENQLSVSAFPQTSVFSKGSWYKFKVTQSGVYKLTYTQIKNLGIDNPANVRIYGNGGSMLPEVYSGNVPDDPREIPIMMFSGTDGIFNNGDYIAFYAQGPTVWHYDSIGNSYGYEKNRYSDSTVYFITASAGGKRIGKADIPLGNSTVTVTAFDGYDAHEADQVNLLHSGRVWYGEEFGLDNSYSFTFNFPGIILSEPVKLSSEVAARSVGVTSFTFGSGNTAVGSISLPSVDEASTVSDYASDVTYSGQFTPASDQVPVTVSFNANGDNTAQGWLHHICLNVRQTLAKSSGQLMFRDSRSVGPNQIADFKISGASSELVVLNIDDIHNPLQMQGTYSNNTYSFNASVQSLHQYVAFDPQTDLLIPDLQSPASSVVPNQNLHAIQDKQLVIVTHPDFLNQAQELANWHETKDQLSTAVVTTDQVYNEFSSGTPDPAAIRNFMKMLYDRAQDSTQLPRYLLLFGDGSFDNKHTSFSNGSENSNYIVTYESENSLSQTYSYVSDDYFGLLDNGETITTGLLDIGVGRLPVSSVTEASDVVNKIKKYYARKSQGDWRNTICFMGDAGDENLHMQQADQLAAYVNDHDPVFNIQKIYVDALPAVSTSSGVRCPDANAAILEQMNKGALIMNYTGHGGEQGLSNEQILTNSDVDQWNNSNYPLFVTATCELSRFDDYTQTTCGEKILLNPNGGGIGLLTTTRLVYSGPNFVLNTQFYTKAFDRSSDNPNYRLGDMIRITKNNAGPDINKLNFTLLGDPALSLAIPSATIITDSINHQVPGPSDTLKAYGKVILKGRVTDANGNVLRNFNGIIYPTIYDKPQIINTLGNYAGNSFPFQLQQSVLFRGKASVVNGEFDLTCLMPRNINYNYGFGKISYYASDSVTDASGFYNQVVIGGLSDQFDAVDTTGPKVRLFMNDTTFKNGGITGSYPTLLALVADNNGIDPGGNGIGHDIVATIDNDPSERYVLDSYYETNLDDYLKGSVTYPFPKLSPGNHEVTFRIWDIFNNSTQATLNFKVVSDSVFTVGNVYNYPNPFRNYTYFVYESNLFETQQDVTIDIFSLAGVKVAEVKTTVFPDGYTSGPILWSGENGNGNKIRPGIYFYRIIVRSNNQSTISKAQKLIIVN